MTPYQAACEKRRQAENECLAELFAECCSGNPYVTDENGNWLTKEEVYQKFLRGDER